MKLYELASKDKTALEKAKQENPAFSKCRIFPLKNLDGERIYVLR